MKTLTVAITAFIVSCGAVAEPPPVDDSLSEVYVQAWVGALSTDNPADPQTSEGSVGNLGTLPYGGGAAQRLWGSGAWRIGYEGGGLASWKNDHTEFFASSGNGTLAIRTHNTFLSFGVFMGGVASANLTRKRPPADRRGAVGDLGESGPGSSRSRGSGPQHGGRPCR